MINFEPCNPPLVDPLFLSCITLGSDTTPKPRIYLQQDLKISLPLETYTKTFPLRPIAIRPDIKSTSPPRNLSEQAAPNVTISSPQQPGHLLDSHRCVSPITSPNCSIRNNRIPPISSPCNTFTPIYDTSPRNFIPSNLPDKISTNLKISPNLKKSTRASPYSSKTSPSSTPNATKSERRRNERQGISETQFSILKDWFGRYTYLTIENRKIVSQETGLPEKTVMYWFQNQRRKVKRQNIC